MPNLNSPVFTANPNAASQSDLLERGGEHSAAAPLSVLIVQPQGPATAWMLETLGQRPRTLVALERSLRQAKQALASLAFDVVVVADQLPDGRGMDLIAGSNGRRHRWRTIVTLERSDPTRAAAAMRHGAADVFEQGVAGNSEALLAALDGACAAAPRSATSTHGGGVDAAAVAATMLQSASTSRIDEAIIGQSPAMQRLRADIRRIAPVPVDVLLIGETGSGKDLVLQQLHAASGRKGALVALNCGAIPDTLFESELFGHDAGAFTGAAKARAGSFERADGGTLFLDEIDSMPIHQQVKLLRVLETRRISRVGGRGEIPLDLRIVAASQGGLEERCRQGLFRLDLLNRLNVVTLTIPALRMRREDVPMLLKHHIDAACARFGIEVQSLPPLDVARLAAREWPGNVRELKHEAERFVLGMSESSPDCGVDDPTPRLASQLAKCERDMIVCALERHDGGLTAAAKDLGISTKTLSRRLSAHQMQVGRRATTAERSGAGLTCR